MSSDPLYVTRPLLPPLEEFVPYLEKIWASKWLTNGGPMHSELESRLADYLGVEHLALFTNGTIALMTALQALDLSGEVITTPYSFVATAHALVWNDIEPVFIDIDPRTCNLDQAKLEAAITPRTTAILAVHCYGVPCDVTAIKRVADAHGLKVIYDAAHAFGVQLGSESLLRHGDLSVLSFHATKVFHTFEGGAIVCPDAEAKTRIDYLKNFGFYDETTILAAGINGKMSEVQAAMGLLHLRYIDDAIARRAQVAALYRRELAHIPGVKAFALSEDGKPNHSYFPVLVDAPYPQTRDELYLRLRDLGIFTRRYFFPLISDMPMYRRFPSSAASNLPHARWLADHVLCLPIYPDLSDEDVSRVVAAIAG